MRTIVPLIFAALLTTTITGCYDTGFPTTKELEAMYRRNPTPKQTYRITLSVAEAPGPFAKAEGSIRYEAPNCGYIAEGISGVSKVPYYYLPIKFSKNGENTFAATIHADAMLDEDYLGRGVCRWQLMSVTSSIRATGAKTDIEYVVGLSGDELRGLKADTSYFVKDEYPGNDPSERSDLGNADPNWYRPELQGQLFSATLTPAAETP